MAPRSSGDFSVCTVICISSLGGAVARFTISSHSAVSYAWSINRANCGGYSELGVLCDIRTKPRYSDRSKIGLSWREPWYHFAIYDL